MTSKRSQSLPGGASKTSFDRLSKDDIYPLLSDRNRGLSQEKLRHIHRLVGHFAKAHFRSVIISADKNVASFKQAITGPSETAAIIAEIFKGCSWWDPQRSGHLMQDRAAYRAIVIGIIGNVLVEQVFGHPFFGWKKEMMAGITHEWEARDADGDVDAFTQKALRVRDLRRYFENARQSAGSERTQQPLPPDFDTHVNYVVAAIWMHLKRVYALTTEGSFSLEDPIPIPIARHLRGIVTRAAILSIAIHHDPWNVYRWKKHTQRKEELGSFALMKALQADYIVLGPGNSTSSIPLPGEFNPEDAHVVSDVLGERWLWRPKSPAAAKQDDQTTPAKRRRDTMSPNRSVKRVKFNNSTSNTADSASVRNDSKGEQEALETLKKFKWPSKMDYEANRNKGIEELHSPGGRQYNTASNTRLMAQAKRKSVTSRPSAGADRAPLRGFRVLTEEEMIQAELSVQHRAGDLY